MDQLFSKISSYNLFNFLFPGSIFWILSRDVIPYPVADSDIIGRLFLYYFIGLVISRLGALIIERILKNTRFVRFADYGDYVAACRKDPKIEIFLEIANTYRTLSALFVLLLLMKLYARINTNLPLFQGWGWSLLAALLLIIFLFSYQRQSAFITKRVEANA